MKFFQTAAITALATGLAAPAAFALDFGNGFTLTGDVELEYISPDGGDDVTFGFTDLTLGWRSQGGGAVGLGFDLSLVSFHDLDDSESESTFWGGLVLTTAFGDVTIGSARVRCWTSCPIRPISARRAFLTSNLAYSADPTLHSSSSSIQA